MKNRKHVLGGAALLAILIGLLLPSEVRRVSHVDIDAPAATVFALLNDFRRVDEWSARLAGDPNVRIDLSGPPRGTGASRRWQGRIAGSGLETIVASEPYRKILVAIDLGDGRETSSTYELEALEGGTRVTWTHRRDYGMNLIARFFAPLLGRVAGPDGAEELRRLADLAESLPGADFSELQIAQIVVEAQDIAYLTTNSLPTAAAISEAMGDAYFDILNFIDANRLAEAGPPLSITRRFAGGELVFDAAIPVRNLSPGTPRSAGRVKLGRSYQGPVLRARHTGPYSTLAGTHEKIAAYIAALGYERNGDAWEAYVSDPTRTAEASLLTFVYYPIRH